MLGKKRDASYGRIQSLVLPDEGIDPQILVERLLERFRSPGYQPPTLPAAALELLELARHPEVSFEEIIRVLQKDALIAARVLKVAQSAAYAIRGPIHSLHQALVRLGLSTLTDIFLEVAFNMRVFRAPGYEEPMNQVRKHSTATAHIARIVCRHTYLPDEYAFLCGLLHDMGIVAGMITLTEVPRGATVPDISEVWPALIECHERAAAVLCRLWQLPPDVEMSLSCHHRLMLDGRVHPLAAAIAIAEALATKSGLGVTGELSAEMPAAAVDALGLAPRALELIVAEAETVALRIE